LTSSKSCRRPKTPPWSRPQAGHIAQGDAGSADNVKYRTPFNTAFDGNTVELNVEQAKYGKSAADYQATLNFLEQRVSGIRKALRGD
jgi:flagellar basal-body rod protein FlgB